MNIVQLTPGAGAMYCGNCLRDNSLVAALRGLGHEAFLVPLYLPLTLDEPDESANHPVFFGGISVYLEQKWGWFRRAPAWLHRLLAARPLLRWAAGKAAKTRPEDTGELALSMLRGELGNQARELEALLEWLSKETRPEVVCLSNALLLGSARELKKKLQCRLSCMLQGEDSFLDGLPEPHRADCWLALKERAAEVDQFVSPSRYFGELMRQRLGLRAEQLRVVYNGINLAGYDEKRALTGDQAASQPARGPTVPSDSPPVLGYLARMCREKGLDTLVEAFVRLRQRGKVPGLKLRVAGSCGPADESFVRQLRQQLAQASLLDEAEFHPNLPRAQKIDFLRGLTVFSVPARYGEAFGLYLLEALAAGVPVVQPRTAAFPEVVAATGGGVLCEPGNSDSLATEVESLLLQPERARNLRETGRRAVFEKFSAEAMAGRMLEAWAGMKAKG